MKKFFSFIFIAFVSVQVQSQVISELILLTQDSSYLSSTSLFGLRVDADYYSNSVSNAFLKKMTQGGFINEALKSSVYDQLDESNRAYARLASDLYFYNMADTVFPNRDWGLSLSLGARVDAQAVFSEDLFRLSFSGNKPFAGREADLSNSSGSFVQYQKVGIGLFHKKSFSGVNVSFVNGQELFSTQIDNAQLFTSNDADSIALTYQGDAWYSDDSNRGFGVGNGAGAAIDLFWNLTLADGNGLLMIGLQDFGFIQWSSRTTRYSANNTFPFKGWDLEEVLDSDNPISFSSLRDSLAVEESKEAHLTLLPANLDLALIKKISDKYYYKVAVRARFLEVIFPELNAGILYKPNEHLLAGANLAYSVYGSLQLGLSIEYIMGKTWLLQVNSNDALGTLNITERGQSASLSISKFF